MELKIKGIRRQGARKITALTYRDALLEGFYNAFAIEPQPSVLVKAGMTVISSGVVHPPESSEDALRHDFDRIGMDMRRALENSVIAASANRR